MDGNNAFQKNLAYGQKAETEVAKYLRRKGHAVLPIYDIEYETGKGPRLFLSDHSLVAPDFLVFTLENTLWIECKNKSVFTWHRKTSTWQTGIDKRHYEDYLKVKEKTRLAVWLIFNHSYSQACPKDIHQGSPTLCPTGLYTCSIRTPTDHYHENHGRSGMVYWREDQLKRIDEALTQAATADGQAGADEFPCGSRRDVRR